MAENVTRTQRLAILVLAAVAMLYQAGTGLLGFRQGHTMAASLNVLGAMLSGASFWYQWRYGFDSVRLAVWIMPLATVWLVVQAASAFQHAELPSGVFTTQTILVVLAFTLLSSRPAVILSSACYAVVLLAATMHPVVNWQALLDNAFISILIGGMARFGNQVLNAHSQANYYSVLARRDPLTGLPNRYEARLTFDEWQRDGHMAQAQQAAVMLLDLDHFKRVNDQYGHAAGDRALQIVADVLRQNMRGNDLACRWGGEEFLVVLCATDRAAALVRAQQIMRDVQAIRQPGLPALTVSIGLAWLSEFTNEEEFMNLMDERLYAAKRAGRNTVILE